MRVVLCIIEVHPGKRGNEFWLLTKAQYDNTGSANGDLGKSKITKRMARALIGFKYSMYAQQFIKIGDKIVIGDVSFHMT